MGCDIHGVAQTRWPDGRTRGWFNDLPVEDGRNYALFAALADVRNYCDITPISQPRGLPEGFELDAVGGVGAAYGGVWMGDHSFTWFTLDELLGWSGWGQLVGDVTLRECCDAFLKWLDYLAARKHDGQEVRIVIGFDS